MREGAGEQKQAPRKWKSVLVLAASSQQPAAGGIRTPRNIRKCRGRTHKKENRAEKPSL